MARILLIGTVETKSDEMAYLTDALHRHGLTVEVIDVSLDAGGTILPGPQKVERMIARAARAAEVLALRSASSAVVLGIGGGTGGEIVMRALQSLPAHYPKVLISTLAFDPRPALAASAITLVPTLCDIEGLNATVRQVFENTAAMVAGLVQAQTAAPSGRLCVAVTTLGATGGGGRAVAQRLAQAGYETTVFHANGYGGAALSRFVAEGRAAGVIDLNVHELGRMRLAGTHVPMPDRFTCAKALPRVVLPGALNFLGLDAIDTLTPEQRTRPHYRHSGMFTHAKLTHDEMAAQAAALAAELNQSTAPCHVIIPMGGFSHEDRPGGAIEDPTLREIAAKGLEDAARAYTVSRIPDHINTDQTAVAAVSALHAALIQGTKDD